MVRGSTVDEVARLKEQAGKNLLVSGSISLAQALIGAGLVDAYRFVLCPVALGTGRPLFRDTAASIALTLDGATTLDRGAVSLVYRQRRAAHWA